MVFVLPSNLSMRRRKPIRLAIKVSYLPDGNVEDVAANTGRDSHVAEALPGDDDGRDEVRDGCAGGEKRQSHHLGWDAHRLAHHVRPPYHQVRVRGNPQDRPQERDREELLT